MIMIRASWTYWNAWYRTESFFLAGQLFAIQIGQAGQLSGDGGCKVWHQAARVPQYVQKTQGCQRPKRIQDFPKVCKIVVRDVQRNQRLQACEGVGASATM